MSLKVFLVKYSGVFLTGWKCLLIPAFIVSSRLGSRPISTAQHQTGEIMRAGRVPRVPAEILSLPSWNGTGSLKPLSRFLHARLPRYAPFPLVLVSGAPGIWTMWQVRELCWALSLSLRMAWTTALVYSRSPRSRSPHMYMRPARIMMVQRSRTALLTGGCLSGICSAFTSMFVMY